MKSALYPLKFQPILKDRIWGGQKLCNYFNKKSNSNTIGESWEISTVPGDISVVANGDLKGFTLQELISTYKAELLGQKNLKRFGETFPLLLKFIDAKADLSIQVHPNDTLAKKRHNSFGKTEMWYIMQADTDANLIVGFKQKVNKAVYLKHLENKSLTEILNFDTVKEGDCYFIEAGRVHAIGAGVLLAEIQQTSNITYRVYDWDRVDENGNPRELHNDVAIDAINFNMKDDFRIGYERKKNKINPMVNCSYFVTNYIDLEGEISKTNKYDSFLIYMCIDGQMTIHTTSSSDTISKGETILIPAAIGAFTLQGEAAKVLEVYI